MPSTVDKELLKQADSAPLPTATDIMKSVLTLARIDTGYVPFKEKDGTRTLRFARALLDAMERPPIRISEEERRALEALEAFQRAPYVIIGEHRFAVIRVRYRR
jgi:hypothetical protein